MTSNVINFSMLNLVFDRVYDIERRVKTPEKYLFPSFETICWYAAKHILDLLRGE